MWSLSDKKGENIMKRSSVGKPSKVFLTFKAEARKILALKSCSPLSDHYIYHLTTTLVYNFFYFIHVARTDINKVPPHTAVNLEELRSSVEDLRKLIYHGNEDEAWLIHIINQNPSKK
jgi:tetraacyldisaccharide-1-P 4'-kinase